MNTSPGTEKDVVEDLRANLKESDIKQYLKKRLGGYSRSSVMEYIANIRRQQQQMADTFAHNYQQLREEKESLSKNVESLKALLEKNEAEYQELADSIKMSRFEGEEISVSYVVALKNRISELERQLGDSSLENARLAKAAEHDRESAEEAMHKLEQSEQEKRMLRELLAAQAQKERDLGVEIAELKGELTRKEEEIAHLNTVITGSHLAELNQKVNDLMVQISSQADMLAAYNAEIGGKSRRIEFLEGELEARSADIGNLKKEKEQLLARLDSCLAANQALELQLEEENKKYISLIKEKSLLKAEIVALTRKVDEANARISSLEMKTRE